MTSTPFFSIVIPTRNEELNLPLCLSSIKLAAQVLSDDIEIIVVLNRCTDKTEEIARAAGCKVVNEDAKNLAKIRNAGARAAQGEIIVTIDADSTMSPNMLREIKRAMSRPDVIGGAVRVNPERWSVGIFLTMLCLIPILIRHRISGGLFFCRRADFIEIGGFNEALLSVEDIDFAKRLKNLGRTRRQKFKILLRASITTSCRKFDVLGDWYFLCHPILFWQLLNSQNPKGADTVWYDFKR